MRKVIAVLAHENRKSDIVEWVDYNWRDLTLHDLV